MKTTKWLTLLLALCAALVIVPWMGGAARAEGEEMTWEDLQNALNASNGENPVVLQNNVVVPADEAVTINGNNTVTLDLAGHTLSRSLSEPTNEGFVVKVFFGSTLILMDSSNNKTGTITGGWNSGEGGGVFVDSYAVFQMHGGTITDNTAANGGGVYVAENGVFNVSGSVVISGNTDGAESPKPNNVYLSAGTFIELDGALAEGTRIGITTGTAPTAETPITITSGLSCKGSVSSFFSDNPAYTITDDSGEALCQTVYTVTLLPGEGTGDPIVYRTTMDAITAPDIFSSNNNGFYRDDDGVSFNLTFDWSNSGWQAPAGRYFSGRFDADNGEEYNKYDFLPCDPAITLTARYDQQASFSLSPAAFSLTPSDFDSEGYTSLGITAESLVLGVVGDKYCDALVVRLGQGKLTCGDGELSFQVYEDDGYGDGDSVTLNYFDQGQTKDFKLRIDPAALRNAAPGTYTCSLNCEIVWEPAGEDADPVYIELTLVVPEPEPKPAFTVHSLVLSGEIGVNFFMDLPEIDGVDYSTSYMEFTVSGKDGKTTQDNYDPAQKSKSGEYYGFTCYVNSIQMADTITATFHYTQGTENKTVKQEYSVKEYLDTISNGTFSDEMKALGVAIGSYGYYAQTYLADYHGFSLGTDHAAMPAGTEYTESDYTEAKNGVSELTIVRDTGNSGIVNVSYALVLDSSTGIYIYLEPADDYTGEVTAVIGQGTENAAVKQSDGRYRIHISGISAHKLADMYSITVTAGDTFTIRVSALSYVDTMLNSDTASDKVKNLVVALYQYYEKAMAYKASIQ